MNAHCFPACKANTAEPMPPYPPYWTGGGGTLPPDPTVLAITCPTVPATAVCLSANVTITITGQAFTASTVAYLDATALSTTYVGPTQLKAIITPSTEPVARTGTITVQDGGTVGTGACSFTFTVAPILTLVCPLNPISAVCGSALLSVTANGTLFKTGITTAYMTDAAGTPQPLTTRVITPNQLTFDVDPSTELNPRIATVSLRDDVATALTTCPFEFTQTVLVPTLTYISPDVVGYYDGTPTTYTGTNFDATSVILRGAIGKIATIFVSPTELQTIPDPSQATVAMFEIRVRNGVQPGGPFEISNNMQASIIMNPGMNVLQPATASIAGGPIVVEVLGTNFGMEPMVMIAGTQTELPTVKRSGGWLDVTLTPPAAPGVVTLDVRLGHAHPEGHDDIRPHPNNTMYPGLVSLPFTWTA